LQQNANCVEVDIYTIVILRVLFHGLIAEWNGNIC